MLEQRDIDNINSEFEKEIEKYIKSNIERVYELFLTAIVRGVYQVYKPTTYKRHYQLLQSVVYEVEYKGLDTVLHVFIDPELLDYYSAKKPYSEVSEFVPDWVDKGHQARNYIPPADNQFHNYTPRNYLTLAKELVEKELEGVQVEITSRIK